MIYSKINNLINNQRKKYKNEKALSFVVDIYVFKYLNN